MSTLFLKFFNIFYAIFEANFEIIKTNIFILKLLKYYFKF